MRQAVALMAIPDALMGELAQLLSPRGFTRDPQDMAPWLSDWRGRVHGRAAALLSPTSTKDVQAIVRLCRAHGVRLTIQGGNSGQCAGATPDDSGDTCLLSLRRMNRIRDVDTQARLLSGDAGVILAHAQDAALEQGLRFPLTLGGRGSATLGGLVSTNAGGTQVLRHGTMRALTAGLEVVLPDGSLLDLMTPLAKDNQGPDPKQIFIGGEGAFGIVTGVALRLVPNIAERIVAWLTVENPADALLVLRALDGQLADALEGFELIPQSALDAVMAHVPGTRTPTNGAAPWHLLVEAVASHSDSGLTDVMTHSLAMLVERGLVTDAVIAKSETEADAFWKLRDSISEAERAKGPALQHDISVPVDAMPAFIDRADAALAAALPGVTTLAFGHLGDGNVHYHIRPPAGGDANMWIDNYGESASRIAYDTALALGGSISAEHGIGRVKRALLGEIGDPARVAMLRNMKSAMDPTGLLNPGVLIPD